MESEGANPTSAANRVEGRWEKDEHVLFLKALMKFGKDWKMVEEEVGTRTGPQVRSHSQKYFLKLNKIHKDRRKLRYREHAEKTETQREILQIFTEDDINLNTPLEMSSILKHELYSPVPQRKIKPNTLPNSLKLQKCIPESANTEQRIEKVNAIQDQNDQNDQSFKQLTPPLTRKRSQNKLIKALQQIKQQQNNEQDSYLIYVMKKNKNYFMSGKEIMGLIDFGPHEQEEDEETTTKRKKSFALIEEQGQDTKKDPFDKMQ